MLRSTFLRCVPLVAAAGAFLGLRRVEPEPLWAEPGPDLVEISLSPDPEYVVQIRREGGEWETVEDAIVRESSGACSVDLSQFSPPYKYRVLYE